MAHHSSALESIPPLYGEPGWVENSGLVKILWPLTDTQVTSDFFRFSGLDRPRIEKRHFTILVSLWEATSFLHPDGMRG